MQLKAVAVSLLFGLLLGYLGAKRIAERRSNRRLANLQEQFIALSSHYLLTPVTLIQTAITRLQEVDSLGLEQRRTLYEAIMQGESRLAIIANQLLLMEQIQSGTLKVASEPISLPGVVSDAIRFVEPLARRQQVKISISDATAGGQVRGDARQLKQVLIAVLDNAIKFSKAGGQVGVAFGIGQGLCQIVVADGGTGMSKEVMEHVNAKFYRGTSTYKFDYEGLGLGMYVADRLIGVMGGTVRVESAPGKGTRVTIEFPKL